MNAVTTQSHKTHSFKWLLKREYWENRGGFLWAPIIAGGIISFLYLVLAVIGSIAGKDAMHGDSFQIDGGAQKINSALGAYGDGVLLAGVMLACIVLAFVVFFYALGSLYDDRRDRSILFWKSLPVSDTQMVLSKAAWALLLAPLVAVGVGVVIGLVLWVISALTLSVNGVSAGTAVFTHSHPMRMIGGVLASLPVYILWALPTVGWLMLCSAWARSKPFLWAVLLPILACVMVSMAGILPGVGINYGAVWYTLVYRGLLSVVPGAWFPASNAFEANMQNAGNSDIQGPADLMRLMNVSNLDVLGTPDLWIGAAIGMAFIAISIYLRRWRELAD